MLPLDDLQVESQLPSGDDTLRLQIKESQADVGKRAEEPQITYGTIGTVRGPNKNQGVLITSLPMRDTFSLILHYLSSVAFLHLRTVCEYEFFDSLKMQSRIAQYVLAFNQAHLP